jgi:predicted amino acid dehydrogenase
VPEHPTGSSYVNRFAFVVHPLHLGQIHASPLLRWTRVLPGRLVESLAARLPPFRVSRITGAVSPFTGQRVEGQLIALGATPRQMMRRGAAFTYRRLVRAARMAHGDGARIMGLGAFTSVIGDAGVTVAARSPIAITSGNSLTVAATLEAAKVAAAAMGQHRLPHRRAMVIGATGSIGSACSRLLAEEMRDIVLVSIEPEKLVELERTILRESSGARVVTATHAGQHLGSCDVIVTATSAFGQRILDISRCKPGAIICDVARPPDIDAAEAALRPDVLVVESGEVLIPGEVDFHYDIGLPRRVAYACLAETALLAMEGRFESFTLGRSIRLERVREIQAMFCKHGFRLAGLRSPGSNLDEANLTARRELADRLRAEPERLDSLQRVAALTLAGLPPRAKGVADAAVRPRYVRASSG